MQFAASNIAHYIRTCREVIDFLNRSQPSFDHSELDYLDTLIQKLRQLFHVMRFHPPKSRCPDFVEWPNVMPWMRGLLTTLTSLAAWGRQLYVDNTQPQHMMPKLATVRLNVDSIERANAVGKSKLAKPGKF